LQHGCGRSRSANHRLDPISQIDNNDRNTPNQQAPRAEAGSTGKDHVNLVAANGQVIASSKSYKSALNGIESVKRNAPVLRSTIRPSANRYRQSLAS
jgi:uncharacterized protein YegP (UPF0339 family)